MGHLSGVVPCRFGGPGLELGPIGAELPISLYQGWKVAFCGGDVDGSQYALSRISMTMSERLSWRPLGPEMYAKTYANASTSRREMTYMMAARWVSKQSTFRSRSFQCWITKCLMSLRAPGYRTGSWSLSDLTVLGAVGTSFPGGGGVGSAVVPSVREAMTSA